MSGKRSVTVDKLTLRLPQGAAMNREAIVNEVARVLGTTASAGAERIRVQVAAGAAGEGPQAMAARIGRATARHLKTGGDQ